MEKIKDLIKLNRPNLAESSVNTYYSILKTLYKRIFDESNFHISHFKSQHNEIMKYLNANYLPSRRKTILSALFILTELPLYREKMMDDTKEYQTEINKQEKTKTQKDNWIDKNDIDTIYQHLSDYSNILYKKKNLSNKELQSIQNFVILSLLGFRFIAPRRLKDFTDFKIKDINKQKDNYLDGSDLVFNSYKTAHYYGSQRVEIPSELENIINKWISINPTQYLFFDKNQKKLTSVTLNQRLNKILGNKISVNNLRHTYLTDKYADLSKKEKLLNEDMTAMGSSKSMANNYIKLN
jgi:hypothetical protein